jgi:hypothetical protein
VAAVGLSLPHSGPRLPIWRTRPIDNLAGQSMVVAESRRTDFYDMLIQLKKENQ